MPAGASRIVLSGLPAEVGGMVRRHLAAAAVPALALGAAADTLVLALHNVGAEIALGIVLAVAFELYVGYAELIVAADRGEGARPAARRLVRRAAPLTPMLVVTSLLAVTLPLAATGLLVLPGL